MASWVNAAFIPTGLDLEVAGKVKITTKKWGIFLVHKSGGDGYPNKAAVCGGVRK